MHLSSLLGALYIIEQYIAMFENDIMWRTYLFFNKKKIDFPKKAIESLVTFVL